MSDFSTIPQGKRWFLLSAWITFISLLFVNAVSTLLRLSLSQDDSSYLIIIPFVSAAILCLDRQKLLNKTHTDKMLGGTFFLLGVLVVFNSFLAKTIATPGLQLSAKILALILLWVSGFAFLFGRSALRAASFPFLFLLLMVPIPALVLDHIIFVLQEGSAWITGAFFDLVGVPALREGLVFHLARVNIEVAKECSGIRSSMALLILALLVAHFRLRSLWSKILFVTFGLIMMIVKNGIRIATLTLLALYVDPNFLFGRLHRQGGIVFFLVALILLLPVLYFLERSESRQMVAHGDHNHG